MGIRPHLTLVAGYDSGAPYQLPDYEDLQDIVITDMLLCGGEPRLLVDILFSDDNIWGYEADSVGMNLVTHAMYEIFDDFDLETKVWELPIYTDEWDKKLSRVKDAQKRQVPDNQLYKGFAHYMPLYRHAIAVIHKMLGWPEPELDKIKLMLVWGWR